MRLPCLFDLTRDAGYDRIEKILKDSSVPLVIEALKELESIPEEPRAAVLKNLRKRASKKPINKN